MKNCIEIDRIFTPTGNGERASGETDGRPIVQGRLPGGQVVITVIGGANIDIQGYPFADIIPADSNPGRVSVSFGGVGRNIAENAARLGLAVRLVTAFGSDPFAVRMRDELLALGVDLDGSRVLDGELSSIYLCTLDRSRKLHVAIADMSTIERIGPDWIDRQKESIRSSELCVVDANLSSQTLARVAGLGGEARLLLDPVSETKAARAVGVVGSFHAVKPNRREAEILSGRSICDRSGLAKAADELHARGTGLVFISLGEEGLFFSGEGSKGVAAAPAAGNENVSGAGDAATAALAWGLTKGMDVAMLARLAVAAAALTVGVRETVNPALSAAAVERLAGETEVTEVTEVR